jgi:Lipid A 3-O-deacylase (PagL)
LNLRFAGIVWLALKIFIGGTGLASEPEASDSNAGYLSFIPFIRENPCNDNRYRQLAASLPLQGTSNGGEGHPWRAMYGLCLAQKGQLSLHQDWIISYLDVQPVGEAPGGDGVSFGTDFSLQWHHDLRVSVVPYYELGIGIQYSAITPFPAHGSRWTITTNAGAGILIPLAQKLQLNTALRYLHMSNAGLVSDNAGYDAFHFVVGVRWEP